MTRGRSRRALQRAALAASLVLAARIASAQAVPATTPTPKEDETLVLNPFVVDATQDRGYQASSTLAGTRIRTDLADVGSAISVMTKDMIDDLGGHNNETVLTYAVNTEVAGPRGNFSGANRGGNEGHVDELGSFANPNGNTRVRGLISADNTRNFFLSDVPWDGYNVSRVDLQRGPNAILFGLGSPAGVINATTNEAEFRDHGSVDLTFDEFGTQRYSLDINRNVINKQVALRVSLLDNHEKYQQKPAYSHDRRAYGALKVQPDVLNRNGMQFTLSGNFEHGEITSNRPRQVTPEDDISPFWRPTSLGGVAGQTFSPYSDFFVDGQDVFAKYNNVTTSIYTGLNQVSNSAGQYGYEHVGVQQYLARRPDGSVITAASDGNNGPYAGGGYRTLNSVQGWASAAGLPYFGAGGYHTETLSDPSVFDFYHKLLDGPNKGEWAKWNVMNADLSNTFLDGAVGYYLSYFKQNMNQGMWTPLGWDGTGIHIDIMNTLLDGTPNPDVGRAYVGGRTADMGSYTQKSNRDAYRGQVFVDYDFAKRQSGLWAKVLGDQRLTGVYSDEDQKTDYRSIQYANWDPATLAKFAPSSKLTGSDNTGSGFKYYISGDLRGRTSISGANLTNLGMPFSKVTDATVPVRWFDPTWTADASVDPGAAWTNPMDPTNINGRTYTQSNNPANYRGWTTTQGRYVTMNSGDTVAGMSARDYLTAQATLTDFDVKSEVAVWQGTFWNHSIVGIYGWRRDQAHRYDFVTSDRQFNANPVTGGADLSPGTYNYSNPNGVVSDLTTTTRNWSTMLHLNRLFPHHDILPVNIRLYYNEGENFQPSAGRTDVFLKPLPPPGGKTMDESIMISTKDDKYTLRLTKYRTQIFNATSTDGKLQADWALEQILGDGLGWDASPGGIVRGYLNGRDSYSGWANAGGDVDVLKNRIIPAWLKFEKDLKAKFPDFVNAWMGKDTVWGTDNINDYPRVAKPTGVTATEDSTSRGYELEFTANPTNNWRIAINGSKTEAVRDNVPGSSWREVVGFINDAFLNTDVGLSPIWWPQNTFGQRNFGPFPWNFYPDWVRVSALNGQSAGEVRKYRANLITNYTFDTGRLKGVGVGGGYRWEDRSVIAYAPIQRADGTLGVNLDRPFYAPRDETLDLWVSYSRKLTKGVRWKIQLNVFNAFGKNKLIPITAGVDYTRLNELPSTLTPDTVVPMRAYSYSIKQGMSWQLSNTFEF